MNRLAACVGALTLLAVRSAAAETAPWNGFRKEVRDADATIRIDVLEYKTTKWQPLAEGQGARPTERRVVGRVTEVYRGDLIKAGDKIEISEDVDFLQARLDGPWDCPGGFYGNGLRFFGSPPMEGGSCAVLLRRKGDGWLLLSSCFALLDQFRRDAQSAPNGDSARWLKRQEETASLFMKRYASMADAKDPEAAVVLHRAFCDFFSKEGPGFASRGLGVLLDDWERVAAVLPGDRPEVVEAVHQAAAGMVERGQSASREEQRLWPWLIAQMSLQDRKTLMTTLLAHYRDAAAMRDRVKDRHKAAPERKDGENGRGCMSADEYEELAAPGLVRFALQLLALALEPSHPPYDASEEDIVARAEAFVKEAAK